MNTKHTPGNWVFAYGAVYREDTLHDEGSIRIALMDRNEAHTTPCERDANARLIAAAPELLAACIKVAEDPYTHCACAEIVRAAISKATAQ
jgi:hypothetical protein